jgi:SAM-dependent methyltransferase
MTQYTLDNAWQEARERIAMGERVLDPGTIRHLTARGVGAGWRCLEVGGGGGSITEWLCQRVGPGGRVVATDIDPRFLAALSYPTLEVRQHNIASDALEARAFDLIHTRNVLVHVPDREAVLRRLVAALKPGGWLLAEEADFVTLAPVAGTPEAAALFERVTAAILPAAAARGMDVGYGRRLEPALRDAGLVETGAEGRSFIYWGGTPGGEYHRLAWAQLRGLVVGPALTDAEMDRMLALLQEPAFACQSPLFVAAWGRRPGMG